MPRQTVHPVAAVAAAVSLIIPLTGCAIHGLSFIQDDRLTIVHPHENAEISLPMTLEWTTRDYEGYYAVFFDRAPMRPGQSLRSLVPEDDPCRAQPACPTAQWLADRHIYVTDRPSLQVDVLPNRRENRRSKNRHEVVIVLLDASGRRIGESAFTHEFIVDRDH